MRREAVGGMGDATCASTSGKGTCWGAQYRHDCHENTGEAGDGSSGTFRRVVSRNTNYTVWRVGVGMVM